MTDNSRHVVGGTGDVVKKVAPTGVDSTGMFSMGGWFYPVGVTDVELLRVGEDSTSSLARGWSFYLDGASKPILRNESAGFSSAGPTAVTASAWHGITLGYNNSFDYNVSLDGVTQDSNSGAPDPAAALNGTTDVFGIGRSNTGIGTGNFDGRYAWLYYVQGAKLSAAAAMAYLNNPQSLVSDYGPSGTVLANALKILWPGQCATETDKSGVGNHGTFGFASGTGPTLGTADGPSPTTPWSGVCGAAGMVEDDTCWTPLRTWQSDIIVSVW